MTQDFAITLRWNNKPDCVPSDYLVLKGKWYQEFDVVLHTYFFEPTPDKYKVCHMHGIVTLPLKFYRKKLMQYGLHIKIVPIFALPGWLAYCKKNQRSKCARLYKKPGLPFDSSSKRNINIPKENKISIDRKKLFDIGEIFETIGKIGIDFKKESQQESDQYSDDLSSE